MYQKNCNNNVQINKGPFSHHSIWTTQRFKFKAHVLSSTRYIFCGLTLLLLLPYCYA